MPCAILEFPSVTQRGGRGEGKLDVETLFFFPIGEDAGCWCEDDGGNGRIELGGKGYVGLNYVHTMGITIDPTPCEQAAEW